MLTRNREGNANFVKKSLLTLQPNLSTSGNKNVNDENFYVIIQARLSFCMVISRTQVKVGGTAASLASSPVPLEDQKWMAVFIMNHIVEHVKHFYRMLRLFGVPYAVALIHSN